MMHHTLAEKLFLLASMTLPTYAQRLDNYEPTYASGPYNFTYGGKNITGPLYDHAAANPNATRSVKFRPFPWYPANPNKKYDDIEWSWRVNISDFYAFNAVPQYSELGALEDPHVILNTYDFSWTGGGNLSAHLGSRGPVCITTAVLNTWPANVTNAYADGDTNSADCGPALGDACRDALLREGGGGGGGSGRQCSHGKPWQSLPECAGSIGAASRISGLPSAWTWDYNVNNGSKTAPGSTNGTQIPGVPNPVSGGGLLAFNTRPRNATNLTEYYEATNRLHVVMIDTTLIDGGKRSKPILLCMRVNTTKVEDESKDGKDKKDDKSFAVHTTGFGAVAVAVAAATMMMAWAM